VSLSRRFEYVGIAAGICSFVALSFLGFTGLFALSGLAVAWGSWHELAMKIVPSIGHGARDRIGELAASHSFFARIRPDKAPDFRVSTVRMPDSVFWIFISQGIAAFMPVFFGFLNGAEGEAFLEYFRFLIPMALSITLQGIFWTAFGASRLCWKMPRRIFDQDKEIRKTLRHVAPADQEEIWSKLRKEGLARY
jgi:hypothetical protein